MKGVFFDTKHSYKDFKLITNSISVGYPTVKTNYIDVPGRDGSLDLTEALGGIKYNDRQLEFKFTMLGTNEDAKSKIAGFLTQGRKKIILDKDKGYYYLGRCTVNNFKNSGTVAELSVTAVCEPYKYHIKETRYEEEFNGTHTIILTNDRKHVSPVIECDSHIKIGFEGMNYDIEKGKHKILAIRLKEGYNHLTISGNGTVTVTYQEGAI
ncbi:phage tail domain-containing protein [Parablautia intestinalis]|uniref:phage tail domain-containing protein n=1 Tax=Parablautia intestinalis TaxID=2320100 RepID=UPI00256F3676|nr:phage tail domain-containing protein [Parablautia intestinalis]